MAIVCITGDIDYGILEDKKCLRTFFDILAKYDVKMTVPVTAKAVLDYPERIEYITKRGHEVAGHGDVHRAFDEGMSLQVKRIQSMIDTFYDTLGIRISGFRAPWLQHNTDTYKALYKAGLLYDSSVMMNKPIFLSKTLRSSISLEGPKAKFFKNIPLALDIYKEMLAKTITFKSKSKPLVFPYRQSGIIEIPLTNPDDWYLISYAKGPKYKPVESINIGKIWIEILNNFYGKDNVYCIQAHPGRMSPNYIDGLEYFLKKATNNVTFKTLEEVAADYSIESSEIHAK